MSFPITRQVLIAGIVLLGVAAPAAVAQQSRLLIGWTDYAPQYRGQIDRRVTLICPGGGTPGNAYGTDVYSDNSSVCTAATHAGLISAGSGGAVTIVVANGQSTYAGSTRNGVMSQARGAFPGSFTFEPANEPGRVDWTTTAAGIEIAARPLTLVCPPNGATSRIWGTDIYTDDSSICAAAVHAGRISFRSGGAVTIEPAGPQPSFPASERNGVASLFWRRWPASFRVIAAAAVRNRTPPRAAIPEATLPIAGTGVAGVTVTTPPGGLITTEAGGTAIFTVRLNAQPVGDVVIPLTSSSAAEGVVSPSSLTFNAANWMTAQTVTVSGVDDHVVDGNQVYSIRTGFIQAVNDSAYNNYNAADPTVTNTDNDIAGVVVSPITGLVTTEGGAAASFSIVLTSAPIASVTISLSSTNLAEGRVTPASISFGATNWSTPQVITIRGVDDSAVDGNVGYSIVTSNAISTDSRYNGVVVADVIVTNRDDDRPAAILPTRLP